VSIDRVGDTSDGSVKRSSVNTATMKATSMMISLQAEPSRIPRTIRPPT
jgi:hypothetical protein